MEKQLAVIELPQELEVLNTPNLGLSKDKATEHLLAFAPFMTQLTELSSGLESINFTEPSDDDSKKAREIRLAMVKVRTGAEKVKDDRKKSILQEGNLIQSAFNLIKSACEMKEKSLIDVEQFRAKIEAEKKARITAERMEKLAFYNVNTDAKLIGEMTESTFEQFLKGVVAEHNEKLEMERKAEEARLEAERKNELRLVRGNAVRMFYHFMSEQEQAQDLSELEDEEFNSLVAALVERKEEEEKKKARIAAEKEAAEKELQLEREKAAQLAKEAEEKLRKEREEAQAKIREAEEAKAKAEAEAKRLEEERIAKEKAEKERLAKEEKERKAAERKAKNASDKVKIAAFISELENINFPSCKAEEAKDLVTQFQMKFKNIVEEFQFQADQL